MRNFGVLKFGLLLLVASVAGAQDGISVKMEHNRDDEATPAFKFKSVPSPSAGDSGTKAKFSLVDGTTDANSGSVGVLNDGRTPTEEDSPRDNFFFTGGTDGGRILADLADALDIKQVNTYSWHTGSRAPQVYELYAGDASSALFDLHPSAGKDPATCGWKLIAKVDTRASSGDIGGQYGVSISCNSGTLGRYRYLLFVCHQTENNDPFGNTFYSEIDIVAKGDSPEAAVPEVTRSFTTNSADGKCEITIDTTAAPDLEEWANRTLAPALTEWYPKIVAMLPSEGFTPPARFSVTIKPGRGVADTAGTRVNAYYGWMKSQTNRQAIGSIVHEAVHVVQQYGHGRRNNPNASRNPGWLVEGIADYIRFYKFEPQTHGAKISRGAVERARYDASYRVTANFLNWVVEDHDKDIVRQLNAAMREGKYNDEIWRQNTGKTVEELGADWKTQLKPQDESGNANAGGSNTNSSR